jgi:hypothetical protein
MMPTPRFCARPANRRSKSSEQATGTRMENQAFNRPSSDPSNSDTISSARPTASSVGSKNPFGKLPMTVCPMSNTVRAIIPRIPLSFTAWAVSVAK